MCVLWSQLYYPLALNSKTLFEAIIDGNDQAMSGATYTKWLLDLFSDEVRTKFLNDCYVVGFVEQRVRGSELPGMRTAKRHGVTSKGFEKDTVETCTKSLPLIPQPTGPPSPKLPTYAYAYDADYRLSDCLSRSSSASNLA